MHRATGRFGVNSGSGGAWIARRAGILLAGLAVAAVLVGSAWALAPATGNRAAIAFYRAAAARNNSVAIQRFLRRGYMSFYALVGRTSSFGYLYARGTVPRGYVRATEHLTYAQRRGRVVWASDVLTPPACHSFCVQFPLELVADAHGRFARFLKAGAVSHCWVTLRPGSTLPFAPGGANFATFGRFLPLLRRGQTVIARSVYRWSQTQTARESDRFAAASKLWEGTVVHVSRGRGKGQPAFTFTDTDVRNLSRYQGPPRTAPLCRS
jgi:hypothetical protein